MALAPLRWHLVLLLMASSCRCTTRSVTRRVARIVRNEPTAAPSPTDPPASPDAPPTVGGCALFPPDDPWNRDVSNDPVDPRSDAYIANIARHGPTRLHADFGSSARHGIPFAVVPESQPPVPVTYDEYGDESDPGPFPIPLTAPIEAGRDRHVLVVQRGRCMLYELYHARPTATGWLAGCGASFDLRRSPSRPRGWTTGDQAGMPILPGLVRYADVASGRLRHALRVTFDHTQDGWVPPANHPGGERDDDAPPMGLRLRMKAGYDLSRFTGQTRIILEGLKRYGLMVADTGTNWFVCGAPDPRWDDDDLDQLADVPGSAFEVVRAPPVQRR